MTDRPPPPGPEESPPQPSRGGGPVIGFVLTLLLAGAGFLLGLGWGLGALITPIVLIAGGWVLLGRHLPGYGRGAARAIAVIAIVFTACIAILSAAFSGS